MSTIHVPDSSDPGDHELPESTQSHDELKPTLQQMVQSIERVRPEYAMVARRLNRLLSDIGKLSYEEYCAFLGVLTFVRATNNTFIDELSTALEKFRKQLPENVVDLLVDILFTVRQKQNIHARCKGTDYKGESADHETAEWILWTRLFHDGINMLNPQRKPGIGGALSTDHSQYTIRGEYRGDSGRLVRTSPLSILRQDDKTTLIRAPYGTSQIALREGDEAFVGRPLDIANFFGVGLLPHPIHRVPHVEMSKPFSRMALRIRRRNGAIEVEDRGTWMPLVINDGANELTYSPIMTEKEKYVSFGESQGSLITMVSAVPKQGPNERFEEAQTQQTINIRQGNAQQSIHDTLNGLGAQ